MSYYQASTSPRTCCFGSFEVTVSDDKHIAPRKAPKPMIQRRASLPRAMVRGSALSAPSALIPYTPSRPASEQQYYYAVPSDSTPSLETPEERAEMAKQIAEILAPTSLAMKYEDAWREYHKEQQEYYDQEETRLFGRKKERYIEEEAVRRVRDRNRRKELRLLEERARDNLEYDIQSPASSRSRRVSVPGEYGSRDKLVVVNSGRRNSVYRADGDYGRREYEFSRRKHYYY